MHQIRTKHFVKNIRIRSFSSYSVQGTTDQKHSENGHFLRSEVIILKLPWEPKITTQTILHKHLTRQGESHIFAKFWKILTSIMEGK